MHLLKQVLSLSVLLSLVPDSLATHAVYTDVATGGVIGIRLSSDSEAGEPEYHFINTTGVVPNVLLFASGVTWANTVASCSAASSTVWNYLSANNYANTNAILQGTVVGLILIFPTFYINMRLTDTPVATTNDACGNSRGDTVAQNAADAINAYCLAIQSNEQNELPTGYGSLDLVSATDQFADGLEAIATVFLASQADVYAPVCSALGVTWKRSTYRLGHVVRSVFGN